MSSGRIKIHRKIKERERYTDSNTFRLFFHLLISANHKGQKWKGIEIEQGQCIVGRKQLAIDLLLTEQQIRTSLEKLKISKNITSKTTNKYSLITVCNWELYQSNDEEITNKRTMKQPTSNQQVTTNKNDKKEENNKWSKENEDVFWKQYPHARKGKKKDAIEFAKNQDPIIFLRMVKIYKREVNVGIQDAKFVPACERRARDFVEYSDTMQETKLKTIYYKLLDDKKVEEIKQFTQDFGEEIVNRLYSIRKEEQRKQVLSGLK